MFIHCLKRSVLFPLVLLGLLLSACSAPQPNQQPVVRVNLEEARAAYDDGDALFLDVRSAASYANGHIPGAISIPVSEIEARLADLDPERWIITYCT